MNIPSDSDFVFYMQVYRDYPLAVSALTRLRKIYPASRVIVISDGDSNPQYQSLVGKFNVEYTESEKLYDVTCGGEMIHRIIAAFMKKPAAYLVKIDTDTRLDRKFKCQPEGPYLFGNPANHGCLQGGCIIFPLAVCKKFYDSQVFLSEKLKDWKTSWGQLATTPHAQHLLEARATQKKLIGFEWVLLWGCKQLGIENKSFSEVYSRWHETIPNDNLQYAVVHPDKWMHLPPSLWTLNYYSGWMIKKVKTTLKELRPLARQ